MINGILHFYQIVWTEFNEIIYLITWCCKLFIEHHKVFDMLSTTHNLGSNLHYF